MTENLTITKIIKDKNSSKIADGYGSLITIKQWEKFKKKFNKNFDYGGMTTQREGVLNYIYNELLVKC